MDREILEAIQNLKCLIIDYPPGRRVVEPHAFGRSSDGHLLLRAYQTEGSSASGEQENWKLFRLDNLTIFTIGDSFDGPRPGYRRGDKAMKGGVIAEI